MESLIFIEPLLSLGVTVIQMAGIPIQLFIACIFLRIRSRAPFESGCAWAEIDNSRGKTNMSETIVGLVPRIPSWALLGGPLLGVHRPALACRRSPGQKRNLPNRFLTYHINQNSPQNVLRHIDVDNQRLTNERLGC